MEKDVIIQVTLLSVNALLCIGLMVLWPCLVDLHDWISKFWKPKMKVEAFIRPCAKGYFIVEFDLSEDRDWILDPGPWSWGNSNLCMKPWTPCLGYTPKFSLIFWVSTLSSSHWFSRKVLFKV
jgi:hypothetical protein